MENPWKGAAASAPFDQGALELAPVIRCSDTYAACGVDFYLVLSLAAGGTSRWFPDGQGEKPWFDASDGAWSLRCVAVVVVIMVLIVV